MKEIVKIFYGPSKDNQDYTLTINNEEFRVRELGTDFRDDLAISLVRKYKDECDAIAISNFPQELKIKKRRILHYLVAQIRKEVGETPLFDGSTLRKTAIPLAIKKHIDTDKNFLTHKKIAFYMGIAQWNYLSFFEEYAAELIFADSFYSFGLPVALRGTASLERFININSLILANHPMAKRSIKDFNSLKAQLGSMRHFTNADIFVMHEAQLGYLKLNNLQGKTVIIDRIDARSKEMFIEAGVKNILVLYPDNARDLSLSSVIEAGLALTNVGYITEELILDYLQTLNFNPTLITNPYLAEDKTKFAFVVHPLTKYQFAELPGVSLIKNTPVIDIVERVVDKLPSYHYCKIKGIKSAANGKEIEGDLYMVLSTPKMLINSSPERVYKELISICHKAHQDGAKIIGLGAYTKIVGDAGVTVNNNSPIPVTTGNSLSAASTLWAASYGIEKMGLVSKVKNIHDGTCIIIGATGSIGKICSKILAKQWKRVIVVAPRPYKIIELVSQIQEFAPQTEVLGTTDPNKYLHQADLIITSTSAQGEKVLDIDLIKPGCVICDVSRPFDISLDEAARRPDVLIIASGEVELPGDVVIEKTIGLEGGTVYACLAETAILAMEGLYESFSMSRELSYEKVVQIDRLARKHNIRLSAIMGHTGEISENDIELCRRFALDKLKSAKTENLDPSKVDHSS